MLKLQYFGHLMQRTESLEKTLMVGKIEGRRRTGQQRMRWLDGTTNSMHMNLSKLWELVGDEQGGLACCSPWGHKESDKTEWLNWTEACYSFPSKKQVSFNFMAAVTICSGSGAHENKVCHYFHFAPSICHGVMGPDAMILIFWMLSFKLLFHSPVSPSSRDSLVPLCFLL